MGLLSSIIRGLAVKRPTAQAATSAAPVHEAARRAENALRRVPIPGYDVDIVSGGLVERIRVSYDGRRVMVLLGYEKADPGCSFCRFISAAAWSSIVEKAKEELLKAGFTHVLIADSDTGAVLAEENRGAGKRE